MTDHTGFPNARGPFEPKDLLNAFPLLVTPVIEIRAPDDLTMFSSPMPFVPGLCLLPPATIGSAIFKQISDVCFEAWLVVLGDEHLLPFQLVDLRTQGTLGMHRVKAQDASIDQRGG